PRGFRRLSFSLAIEATGSRSSARKPALVSRPLYAGRRLPSHQAPGRLVPGDRNAPGFDDGSLRRRVVIQRTVVETPLVLTTVLWITTRLRRVHFRSSRQHAPARGGPRTFAPALTTTALNRSRLEWFETRP